MMSSMEACLGCQCSTCMAFSLEAIRVAVAGRRPSSDTGMSHPGDAPGRFNDFTVGEALAVAQIECGGGLAGFQVFQRQQVGVDQIFHMDVITHTGAVPGGIVCAEQTQFFPLAQGGGQHQGDQVGFRTVTSPIEPSLNAPATLK